jgi:uncharacterized protein YyaL (SSP411 family)
MSNRLALESSPYLLQHADNPVDWYPWGAAALERARQEDKPIHLSIGYYACHWCHVMAHESFENPQIAQLLNANFVNIKVDRQERPDIDELYQRVVQLMGESGGWPLTVFLTPEQEPFFAGTYFPPEERYGRPAFPRLLQGLARAWRERRHEVRANCEQFLRGFREHDEHLFAQNLLTPSDLPRDGALAFARATDPVHGGLGGAPKFPNVSCQDLMLRVCARGGASAADRQLLSALNCTLDQMAAGGIYDHLGGGFARYSVDERWAVPHFEKMLYDNAQLVKLYADGYRLTQRASWRQVFEESCAYVLRDLRHPDGAFFASEDADSEGEEGRFYAWSAQEIVAALGPEDGAFAVRAYGVTAAGNFEHGRSVLHRGAVLEASESARLAEVRERLRLARMSRVRPGRDENVLAGWNGLMIQGLCAAFQATGTPVYLQAARRTADFLVQHLGRPDGGLMRAWRDGVAKVPGFLDDYGFLANGLFDLYESGFVRGDLDRGLALVDRILDDFWQDGLFFTPGSDPLPLVHRPLAPFDGACPSGLSASVMALLRAHALSGRERYLERARAVLARFEAACGRNFFGFAHLLAAREFDLQGPTTVAFAGGGTAVRELQATVHRAYLPGRVLTMVRDAHGLPGWDSLAQGVQDGAAAGVDAPAVAYVCRANTCLPPVHSRAELRATLRLDAPGV